MASKVKLVWVTPKAEKIISYCARVSSPKNQENYDTAPKLLNYCIKNKHWSIFEMGNICIEITTSRAISAQILRHRSFCFQEFSQRYAKATNIVNYAARRQDSKNRQKSIDDMSKKDKEWFNGAQKQLAEHAKEVYNEALSKGIAKEQARMILPMATETKLYMNGSIRSWIHYINLRTGNGTQLEHQEIANKCKEIFIKELPIISESLGWKK